MAMASSRGQMGARMLGNSVSYLFVSSSLGRQACSMKACFLNDLEATAQTQSPCAPLEFPMFSLEVKPTLRVTSNLKFQQCGTM